MLDAIAAELLKLTRLRATWLLAWIYPVLMLAITILTLGYQAIWGTNAPATAQGAQAWIAESAGFWKIPYSAFGRYLVASLAVFCTASEYGWNTWKLIVPARARWQLLLAKVCAVVGLLVSAWVLADLIAVLGMLAEGAVRHRTIPVEVTLGAILSAHGSALLGVLPSLLYTVAIGVGTSVLTRSSLGAILLSIALISGESLVPFAAAFAAQYAALLTQWAVAFLPFYHVENVRSWSEGGKALLVIFDLQHHYSATLAVSVGACLAWTLAIGAGAIALFKRQDLH